LPTTQALGEEQHLSLDRLQALAELNCVPVVDVLMIALNTFGVASELDYPRSRMRIRPLDALESWQIILPLDVAASPFSLHDDAIWLGRSAVAEVVALENDDVVLTYLRAGGRSLTLNTYSRSTCTGCLFCPNVIEDAADATLTTEAELDKVLSWVCAESQWVDLSDVEVITVCSGCFHTPDAAISHMTALRHAARTRGFDGRLHLLSSVVRARRDLERLAAEAGPFHLTLTLECFSRREQLLRASKASLTLAGACEILDDCHGLGILGDFTYVAGLDAYEDARAGLKLLAEHATTFPRIQVFQAHNGLMRRARNSDATNLNYYLGLRRSIEGPYAARDLAPKSWENYRPLWYTAFAGHEVTGPRV